MSKLELPFDPRVRDALARGLTDKQGAAELGVSYNSYRWHMQQAMKRFGVHTRLKLYLATEPGVLPDEKEGGGD